MPRARAVCSHNAPTVCGQPAVRDGRCAAHLGAARRAYDARRGSPEERGYGPAHAKAKARMLVQWSAAARRGEHWTCPRCNQVLTRPVDADHFRTKPPVPPDRLSHSSCNRGKLLPGGE